MKRNKLRDGGILKVRCRPGLPALQFKIQNSRLRIGLSPGFTLLELIIVTVLATLMLGLATLMIGNTLSSARFDATGRDMVATMRQMRALARNSGEDQVLTIDLDGRQYGMDGGRMKAIPVGVSVKVDDSFLGEVRNGKYPTVFHAVGGVEGGTIILSYRTKTLRVRADPILGAVVERS